MAAAATKTTVKVVKLKSDNYYQWWKENTLVLKTARWWNIVNGSTVHPEADTDDWDQKAEEAQSTIVSMLDQKQTNHISQCESAEEILLTLTLTFYFLNSDYIYLFQRLTKSSAPKKPQNTTPFPIPTTS